MLSSLDMPPDPGPICHTTWVANVDVDCGISIAPRHSLNGREGLGPRLLWHGGLYSKFHVFRKMFSFSTTVYCQYVDMLVYHSYSLVFNIHDEKLPLHTVCSEKQNCSY